MNYIFGIHPPRPVVGIPQGASYRIRMRDEDFAYIFVSRKDVGIFGKYLLMEKDGAWSPNYAMPQSENHRATPNSLQSQL